MNKRFIVNIFVLFIILTFSIIPAISLSKTVSNNKLIQNNKDLLVDFKIRNEGEDWINDDLKFDVGTTLEFKVNVEAQRDYEVIAILVTLPTVSKSPMFDYDWGLLGLGSSEPKPIFPIGEWSANDTDVCWAWFIVDSNWEKEMSFKAKIVKSGSKSINLRVIAVKDIIGNYDEINDSISITADKSKCIKSLFNKFLEKSIIFKICNNIKLL